MDAGLLRFLGLHRVRSVHAHLVCEHTRGDRILYYEKHAVLVGTEHAPRDRPILYTVSNFADAGHQEASASAFYPRRVDALYADAGHLHHRFACSAWLWGARQHLGFAFAHRHRSDARFRFFATSWKDFSL